MHQGRRHLCGRATRATRTSRDKWHLDEVALKINANATGCGDPSIKMESCWTSWSRAARSSWCRTLSASVLDAEGGAEPRVVITDKLASYPPAIRRVLRQAEHRRHKRLNNRAENSHLPSRKRERLLQRLKSAEHAQRFLGPFNAVSNRFRPRRHRLTASAYRQIRTHAHIAWQDVTNARAWHWCSVHASLDARWEFEDHIPWQAKTAHAEQMLSL